MFKLILLAIFLQVTWLIYAQPFKIPTKYTALVKYNEVVYHCQDVVKTECGHSIRCDSMSIHCADNLVIKYI
jgi:hypothetical protein